MKSNIGKCHLLVNTSDKDNIRVGNFDIYIYIYNTKCEKLVWVNFDHKLTFDDLTSELCKTGR